MTRINIFSSNKKAVPPSQEEQKKIFNECKEQEKASEDDIQEFMDYKVPQSPKAKCVLACMHEKSKIVCYFLMNFNFHIIF